jgi:hypothetical protein
MAMPSMSPDDINKQITELNAVESGLQMNMNMLLTTIQTLEVQSATLSAIQTMGQSFSHAGTSRPTAESKSEFESPFEKPADKTDKSASGMPDTAAIAAQFANSALWWNTVQDQFAQAVNQVVTPAKKTVSKKTASKKTAAKKKATGTTKKTTTARESKNSKT